MAAGSATFWGLAANVTTPVFEGGTLWFKRKAAIANYEESAALYKQSVYLPAFAGGQCRSKEINHSHPIRRKDS
jgi:hypothetical protein